MSFAVSGFVRLARWALFGAVCLLPAAAAAQPSIATVSGTPAHNDTLVINGSAFGTKATPAPRLWETFSDGTVDPALTVNGGTFFSNADNLRNQFSKKNARADYKNGGYYFEYGVTTAPQWFVQYWIKLAPNWKWGTTTFGGGDDGLANIKFFRLFPKGSRNYSNVGYSLHGFDGGNVLRFVENGVQQYLNTDARPWFAPGVWHNVQVQYGENSGVDQNNGTLKLWIDGVLRDSTTTLNTNASADGAAINKRPYIIGFYDSWSPSDAAVSNMYAYYSDVYVDTSWARVEIGNAPTYSACTLREIQLPIAWSNTSVSVRVNQGSFTTGQAAYVYVIDANGVVNSNGYRIMIGTGNPTPPTPPANLRIIK